jgi:ABC-type glycerol-3-phosphate transport system permease component
MAVVDVASQSHVGQVSSQQSAREIADAYQPRRGIRWGLIARHTVLMFFSLAVILPLLWVVIRSFVSLPDGTQNEILPQNWVSPLFEHYQWVLEKRPDVRSNFWNSVLVACLTVVACTVTAVLGGYALVHLATPFKRVITAALVASLFFPTRVTAITGIFEIQDRLGFINKTWTLVFPYTALNVAICIFIMRGVFQGVSSEILQAAHVDGASSLITMVHGLLGAGLWQDRREANLLDGGAPFYGTYACADGRHVAVGALEPQFFAALLDGLGLREVFPGAQHDVGRWPEQRALLARTFLTRTRDAWAAHFAGTDACVSPVLSLLEAPAHPHLAARSTFVQVDGRLQPGPAPRLSRTPAAVRSGPRGAGQDTAAALADWGFSTDDVQRLLEQGAVAQA